VTDYLGNPVSLGASTVAAVSSGVLGRYRVTVGVPAGAVPVSQLDGWWNLQVTVGVGGSTLFWGGRQLRITAAPPVTVPSGISLDYWREIQ
jgi:hypothetical protein